MGGPMECDTHGDMAFGIMIFQALAESLIRKGA